MILIYTDTITPRLRYVADFIFRDQFSQSYQVTTDSHVFNDFDGCRIRYAVQEEPGSWFSIPASGLVFEKGIRPLDVTVSECENVPVLFSGGRGDIPFDIFSAIFFCLSRYEEYGPHELDEYGRFAHMQSIAHRYDFLHLPVVNIWLTLLANRLKAFYPGMELPRPPFQFIPTYDIDMAWSYRHKGVWRNMGGFLHHPNLQRWRVGLGLAKDPFDSYDFLDRLHEQYELRPVYFFLMASSRGRYDKNISPRHPAMQNLIDRHARKYEVGIHPSWASHQQPACMSEEMHSLSVASGKKVSASRQHYIKFSLPETFRQLIRAGISDEYSMGYGSINGFRASVASSFNWYDLQQEEETTLRLHPFCFMDANAYYEQKQDIGQSSHEIMQYLSVCHQHHGTMISIFHNQFLGSVPAFSGWKEMYETFISQVPR